MKIDHECHEFHKVPREFPVLGQNVKFLAKLGDVRILKGFFGLRSARVRQV